MTDNKSVWIYYLIAFSASIISGYYTGFTHSHTPPLPFVIELFLLPIGFIWMLAGLVLNLLDDKSSRAFIVAHLSGLAVNCLFVAAVLFL